MTPSQARTQHRMDLLAVDLLPECPTCGDYAPAGATRCECGQRLLPGKATARPGEQLDAGCPAGQKETIMTVVPGCTCGGRGVCVACVLDEYDGGQR